MTKTRLQAGEKHTACQSELSGPRLSCTMFCEADVSAPVGSGASVEGPGKQLGKWTINPKTRAASSEH